MLYICVHKRAPDFPKRAHFILESLGLGTYCLHFFPRGCLCLDHTARSEPDQNCVPMAEGAAQHLQPQAGCTPINTTASSSETQGPPTCNAALEPVTLRTVWVFGEGSVAQGHVSCSQFCGGPGGAETLPNPAPPSPHPLPEGVGSEERALDFTREPSSLPATLFSRK